MEEIAMDQKGQPTHEERVRLRAYEIWLNEGRPDGRDARHWEMAREAIGYDDAARSTLEPAPEIKSRRAAAADAAPAADQVSFKSNGNPSEPSMAASGSAKSKPRRKAL
jgi:hypothetical protein